jgi:hypothetical protein
MPPRCLRGPYFREEPPKPGENSPFAEQIAPVAGSLAPCLAFCAPLACRIFSPMPMAASDLNGSRQALEYGNRFLPIDAPIGDAAPINERHAGDKVLTAG